MEGDDFIKDTMTWSFSRLNYNCLCEWRRRYIDCDKEHSQGNFFASVGGLMHKIFEKYVKGELEIFEISQYFIDHWDEWVKEPAPYSKNGDMKEKYYNDCLDYLDNLSLNYDKYNILGVEKEMRTQIPTGGDPIDMIGYIDLLVEDKETKEITIFDYKSAIIKWKKRKPDEPLKSDAAHWLAFQRQLYIYSKMVMEKYRRPVKYLGWIMFRANEVRKIEWNQQDYNAAIKWAGDTADALRSVHDYPPNLDSSNRYYCINLCSYRDSCVYRAEQAEFERKMRNGDYAP